jgi:hypothetical protein
VDLQLVPPLRQVSRLKLYVHALLVSTIRATFRQLFTEDFQLIVIVIFRAWRKWSQVALKGCHLSTKLYGVGSQEILITVVNTVLFKTRRVIQAGSFSLSPSLLSFCFFINLSSPSSSSFFLFSYLTSTVMCSESERKKMKRFVDWICFFYYCFRLHNSSCRYNIRFLHLLHVSAWCVHLHVH